MNYLAIDTSGQHLSVIISYNGSVEEIFEPTCGVDHSTRLMPTVEKAVEKLGVKLNEIDVFACSIGAGSFTGIRIGVSAVKAFAYAFNKKCLAVTSFDTIAYNTNEKKVLTVIDAKHGNYYVCGYQDKKVVLEPCFIDEEKLNELKEEYLLASYTSIGKGEIVVSPLAGLKNAVEALKDNATLDINQVKPLYIRKSQAEEGR